MVHLNFLTSKHGSRHQFLKHGQKFYLNNVFWFRKKYSMSWMCSIQQHRWQVTKSDGSYYNKMTSMLIEGRTSRVFLRLSFLYSYDFCILITLCCITDSANICLTIESIPLLLAGGLYICCQGRCWVWSTSKREDDPESFIIISPATVSCVLGVLTLTSTQLKSLINTLHLLQ